MPSAVFSRVTLSRGSTPGAGRAKAHYIAREASYGPGERKVHYVDRTDTHRVRDDLAHAESGNLPSWAKTPADFFSAAEQYERAGGTVLFEQKFDVPRELTHEQQCALIRDMVAINLGTDHAYSWALHTPQGLNDLVHSHAHVIWSAREVDTVERSPEHFFRRPNVGGARKTPRFNQWGAPAMEKQLYSDLVNLHCERADLALHYHPGSLASRGLAMTPEPKLLPSDSWAYQSRGIVTPTMHTLLDHRTQMAPHRAEEAADAREYWEHRQQQLGITREISHELALERIAEAHTRSLTTPPRRQREIAREHEILGVTQHLRALEQHEQQLTLALTLEQAYTRMGRQVPERTAHQHDALLSEGQALGIDRAPRPSQHLLQDRAAARERQAQRERPAPGMTHVRDLLHELSQEDEAAAGVGLKVRLHEHEHDRSEDRGMSW